MSYDHTRLLLSRSTAVHHIFWNGADWFYRVYSGIGSISPIYGLSAGIKLSTRAHQGIYPVFSDEDQLALFMADDTKAMKPLRDYIALVRPFDVGLVWTIPELEDVAKVRFGGVKYGPLKDDGTHIFAGKGYCAPAIKPGIGWFWPLSVGGKPWCMECTTLNSVHHYSLTQLARQEHDLFAAYARRASPVQPILRTEITISATPGGRTHIDLGQWPDEGTAGLVVVPDDQRYVPFEANSFTRHMNLHQTFSHGVTVALYEYPQGFVRTPCVDKKRGLTTGSAPFDVLAAGGLA